MKKWFVIFLGAIAMLAVLAVVGCKNASDDDSPGDSIVGTWICKEVDPYYGTYEAKLEVKSGGAWSAIATQIDEDGKKETENYEGVWEKRGGSYVFYAGNTTNIHLQGVLDGKELTCTNGDTYKKQ